MNRLAALRTAAAGLFLIASCTTTAPPEEPDTPAIAQQPPPPPPPTDPRVSELQVLVAELLDRIEVLNARLARLEGGAPPPAPVKAAAPPPSPVRTAHGQPDASRPAPASVTDRYREAITLFGKGRLDDARAAFQEIFDADPTGELADNALYWIGETLFVTARYAEAMKYYERIGAEYPNENKAPDAMLKLGLAYVKLGDLILAKKTLNELIARHPYSIPAATAKAELERIRY